MATDTRICKNPDCQKKHDGNQVKRSLGNDSMVYLLEFCSAQCYTQMRIEVEEETHKIPRIKTLKKNTATDIGRKAYIVDVLNEHDMGVHEETVLKAEGDLWLYLRTTVSHVLNEQQMRGLTEKIESYASEKFESGKLQ